jgi:hypothetical protein
MINAKLPRNEHEGPCRKHTVFGNSSRVNLNTLLTWPDCIGQLVLVPVSSMHPLPLPWGPQQSRQLQRTRHCATRRGSPRPPPEARAIERANGAEHHWVPPPSCLNHHDASWRPGIEHWHQSLAAETSRMTLAGLLTKKCPSHNESLSQ